MDEEFRWKTDRRGCKGDDVSGLWEADVGPGVLVLDEQLLSEVWPLET